jgi:hypothetical protein
MMSDEEVEEEIKRIEITEAAKAEIIGLKVREVANGVIETSSLSCSNVLLKLIPEGLLNTEITDLNLHDVGIEIKKIRDEQKKDKIKAIRFLTLLLCTIIRL